MPPPPPPLLGVAADMRRGDAPIPVITDPLPVSGDVVAAELDVAEGVVFLNAEPARAFRSDMVSDVDGLAGPMLRSIDGCREPPIRLAARAYLSTDESRLGGRL